MRDILVDQRIPDFMLRYQYEKAGRNFPVEKRQQMIEQAIADRQTLSIVYLKEKGEKSFRTIQPKSLRPVEYQGEKCLGVEAYCLQRKSDWIFRLPCIVEMAVSDVSG